jgi:hypothetical protein
MGNATLELISPKPEQTLRGQDNDIEWKFNGDLSSLNIDSVVIEYSLNDKDEFKQINKIKGTDTKIQNWDVSAIENAEYKLRIKAVDAAGATKLEVVSQKFVVANRSDQGKVLSIFNLSPENKQEINDKMPTLSANFAASENGTIIVDDIEVKFNNRNITDECSIDEVEFKCEISEELDLGEHTVEVSITDTNDQSLNQSWLFNVVEDTGADDSGDSGGTTDGGDDGSTPVEPGFSFAKWFEDVRASVDTGKLLPICGGLLLLLIILLILNTLRKKKAYDVDDSFSTSSDTTLDPFAVSTHENSTIADEPFDFSVGSHAVDDPGTPQFTAEEGVSSGSEELPDWLRGDESTDSQPVGSQGEALAPSSEADGSQVHGGSFDMTPPDDDGKAS